MASKPPPFGPSKLFKDDHDLYPANVMLKAQILPIKSIKDRQSISASSDCSLFQQIYILSKHLSHKSFINLITIMATSICIRS